MRVTIVLNGRLESLPPVLSVCHALAETGHHVHLITNFIEPENAGELREKGVKITTFRKHPDIRNTSLPVPAVGSRSGGKSGTSCGRNNMIFSGSQVRRLRF